MKTKTRKTAKKPTSRPMTSTGSHRQSDKLIAMIERGGGATMDELTRGLGVQPHTARAMISVARRKRGLSIEKRDGRYEII